ncbi:unnamed protein product [Brassica rapa subsp. trilocularis]|uniref:Uncharacterized protein n=1 Tax=Brassica campestris TaxID=3711 RepID=A0A3P5ZT62_BRACM|nr:unnamed protein product [Brassica rapa]
MVSCDTTIGPLLHRQARCLTSASTVFSVPTVRMRFYFYPFVS